MPKTAPNESQPERAKAKAKGADRSKNPTAQIPRAAEEDPTSQHASASEKRTRILFDEEGLDPGQDAQAPKAARVDGGDENGDEDEDSDSDAPEAVSTAHLASLMKASARKAQIAAQDQAAAQKRKRRERDVALKKRATERKAATVEAAQGEADEENGDGVDPDSDGEARRAPRRALGWPSAKPDADVLGSARAAKGGRIRYQPITPALLPAELLTDSNSDPGSDSDSNSSSGADGSRGGGGVGAGRRRAGAVGPAPKRRRVETVERLLAKERKAPADKKVGSTVYRVMERRGDGKQAPASSRRSTEIRDSLRKRQRSAVAVNRGFFGK